MHRGEKREEAPNPCVASSFAAEEPTSLPTLAAPDTSSATSQPSALHHHQYGTKKKNKKNKKKKPKSLGAGVRIGRSFAPFDSARRPPLINNTFPIFHNCREKIATKPEPSR